MLQMSKIKISWFKIKSNPMHMVVSIVLSMLGLFLIDNDTYFKWPPVAVKYANSDFVGFLFIATGLGIFYWVISKHQAARLNHFLLIIASMLVTLLTMYELLHYIVLGLPMPWISNIALIAVILNLAYRSDPN